MAAINPNFNPATDSWAPGEAMPLEQGTAGLDAAGATLAARGQSDLYQSPQVGQSAATPAPSDRLYVSPGAGSSALPGSGSGGTPLTNIFTGAPADAAQQGAIDQLNMIGSGIAAITSAVVSPSTVPAAINNAVAQGVAAETAAGSWVIRIIVMILGFIFIATGLHMFGVPTPLGEAGLSLRAVTRI